MFTKQKLKLIIVTNLSENLLVTGPNLFLEFKYKRISLSLMGSRKFGPSEISYSKSLFGISDNDLWTAYSLVRRMNGFGLGTELRLFKISDNTNFKIQYHYRKETADKLHYSNFFESGMSDPGTHQRDFSNAKRIVNIIKFLLEEEFDTHKLYFTLFTGVGIRYIQTSGIKYYEIRDDSYFSVITDSSSVQHNSNGFLPSIHFGVKMSFKVIP